MSDDVDDLVRRAMGTLDRQVPEGYFDALPGRTLARLEEPAHAAAEPEDELARQRAVRGARAAPESSSSDHALPVATPTDAATNPVGPHTAHPGMRWIRTAGLAVAAACAVFVLFLRGTASEDPAGVSAPSEAARSTREHVRMLEELQSKEASQKLDRIGREPEHSAAKPPPDRAAPARPIIDAAVDAAVRSAVDPELDADDVIALDSATPGTGAAPSAIAQQVRDLYVRDDMAAIVRTCTEATVTREFVAICFLAACRRGAIDKARRWLSVFPDHPMQLVARCRELTGVDVQAPGGLQVSEPQTGSPSAK